MKWLTFLIRPSKFLKIYFNLNTNNRKNKNKCLECLLGNIDNQTSRPDHEFAFLMRVKITNHLCRETKKTQPTYDAKIAKNVLLEWRVNINLNKIHNFFFCFALTGGRRC